MDLHPKAQQLLDILHDHGGPVTVDELEDELSHGDIMRPADWLAERNLIDIDEVTEHRYELTSTGEKAYINGLPEQQLLELLEDGSVLLQEAQEQLTAFNIALGQARQHGWVEILDHERGKALHLTDEGREKLDDGFDESFVIEKVHDDHTARDTSTLEALMERGLIEDHEETERTLEITEEGNKLLREQRREEEAEEQRERARKARTIGQITPEIIRSGEWKDHEIREYNVEADTEVNRPGKRHPYRAYLDEVRQQLMSMGFQEAKTDLVEMEFWNFDVLFQAQDHPAREIHDKFELLDPSHGDLEHDEVVENVREMHEAGGDIESAGWDYEWSAEKASRLMLRSQTTATTIRYLARGLESPAKVFAIDRNFRYDEIDATHFVEFYQAEGIVKAPDLTLRDLFGYLEVFGKEIAGAEEIRFRPGYFPFTEPSVELDAKHPELGWIELGGAGMFRPEVRDPLGVEDPVIAWGMGIDRLAMFKLGIDDIRELVFPQDLEYLRSSSISHLQ